HQVVGDRVVDWTTVNEPFCSAYFGYGTGIHAPGIRDEAAALRAAHHLLLAHGLGTRALRAAASGDLRVGIVFNFGSILIARDEPEYREAARKVDGLQNRLFLDPVLGAGYPQDVLDDIAHLEALEPAIRSDDLDVIAAPSDQIGINFYGPTRDAPDGDPDALRTCDVTGVRGVGTVPPHGPLPGRAHSRGTPGPAARRRRARLPGVVTDGQLRVGDGLHPAFRHRARGLRDAAAADQGQRPDVLRSRAVEHAAGVGRLPGRRL